MGINQQPEGSCYLVFDVKIIYRNKFFGIFSTGVTISNKMRVLEAGEQMANSTQKRRLDATGYAFVAHSSAAIPISFHFDVGLFVIPSSLD